MEAPRHLSPQKTRWISNKEKLEGPLRSDPLLSQASWLEEDTVRVRRHLHLLAFSGV